MGSSRSQHGPLWSPYRPTCSCRDQLLGETLSGALGDVAAFIYIPPNLPWFSRVEESQVGRKRWRGPAQLRCSLLARTNPWKVSLALLTYAGPSLSPRPGKKLPE